MVWIRNSKFLNKYGLWIGIVFIGFAIYSVLHEVIHCMVFRWAGCSCKISFSFINVANYDCTGIQPPLNLSAVAPYVVGLILMLVLSATLILARRKEVYFISFIPFIDALWNYLMIPVAIWLKKSNDFLVLFQNGYWLAMLIIIFDFALLLLNYHLFRNIKNH